MSTRNMLHCGDPLLVTHLNDCIIVLENDDSGSINLPVKRRGNIINHGQPVIVSDWFGGLNIKLGIVRDGVKHIHRSVPEFHYWESLRPHGGFQRNNLSFSRRMRDCRLLLTHPRERTPCVGSCENHEHARSRLTVLCITCKTCIRENKNPTVHEGISQVTSHGLVLVMMHVGHQPMQASVTCSSPSGYLSS